MFARQQQRHVQNDDVLTLSEVNIFKIVSVGGTRGQDLGQRRESDSDSSSSNSETSSLGGETTESDSSPSGDDDEEREKAGKRNTADWLGKNLLAKKKRVEAREEYVNKQQATEKLKEKMKRTVERRKYTDVLAKEIAKEERDKAEREANLKKEREKTEREKEELEAKQEIINELRKEKAASAQSIQMINDFLTYMLRNERPSQLYDRQMEIAMTVQKHFQFPVDTHKQDFFEKLLQENVKTDAAPERFLWLLMYAYLYIDVDKQVDATVFDFIWKMYCLIGNDEFDVIMLQAFKHAKDKGSKTYNDCSKLCWDVCMAFDASDYDDEKYVSKMQRLFFQNKKHPEIKSFLQPFYDKTEATIVPVDYANPIYTHYYMSETQMIGYISKLSAQDDFFAYSCKAAFAFQLQMMNKCDMSSLDAFAEQMYNMVLVRAAPVFEHDEEMLSLIENLHAKVKRARSEGHI